MNDRGAEQKQRQGAKETRRSIHRLRLSREEWLLWLGSVLAIGLAFVSFDRTNYFTLCTSLIGVTSLVFNAKGDPIGQALMIVFSILYGMISWSFSYYGEMLTYLGMTLPMAVFALVSWVRNPYRGNRAEVKINRLFRGEPLLLLALTAVVTLAFYFVLAVFQTANLIPSTVSVATSFLAAYLTFRRSPYFALAYAANDIVLSILWVLAARTDPTYFSVVVCFTLFLFNDLYGFLCWLRRQKRQMQNVEN